MINYKVNLFIILCKVILGVHNKSTNHAVRGELGSFPLLIHIVSLSIKYWWKLNEKCFCGCNDLVIHALTDNRKLHSLGTFTWSTDVFNIYRLSID